MSSDKLTEIEVDLTRLVSEVLSHPFIKAISEGELTDVQLTQFALEYRVYCEYFPRCLAAVAAAVPDDATRMCLVENLWEEHGSGESAQSHRALFLKFLEALGVTHDIWSTHIPFSSTVECTEQLYSLCRDSHFLVGLGALGPGTEAFTDAEYSAIANGLSNRASLTRDELEFWYVHISLDEHHYSEMAAAIVPWLSSADNVSLVREGATRAIRLEIAFWDGLAERIL